MGGRIGDNDGLESREVRCAELMEAARRGDSAACSELLQLYRQELLNMVSARIDAKLAQRVDASDVVQLATLDASNRLQEYLKNPKMDFLPWLRWITNDRLIDTYREHLGTQKRDARREVSIDAADPNQSALGLAEFLLGTLTSPSNSLQREQDRQRVNQAIAQLSDKEREILRLRHFEQLTTVQTAEALGISRSGASKRYVSALTKLRQLLESEFGHE